MYPFFIPSFSPLNSEATKGSLNEECTVAEEISPECLDYGRFLDELYVLRDSMPSKNDDDDDLNGNKEQNQKRSLADVLKNIKLSPPQSAAGAASPELTEALNQAKQATEQYGIASTEAKLAWETYEEIASSGTENAVGINLMEECSVESGQDACRAMEELERVMPVLLAMSMNKK